MADDTKPLDPQELLRIIWNTAPAYAKAKGERVYIEEYRKTLKARLMVASDSNAIGAQERDAYASQEYGDLLKGLQAATEQEELLRWRLVSAQAGIEVWRSQEASNRTIDRSAA
jgi:hypothetical protein